MLRIRSGALAAACLASFTGTALAAPLDHQQCFKIKDSAVAVERTFDLLQASGSDFPDAEGCTIKKGAALLCMPAEIANENPAAAEDVYGDEAQVTLCYKAKCPKLPDPIAYEATDRTYGDREVVASGTKMICVPAPTTTTTTIATTTTTLPPGSCNTAGDCPAIANAQPACSSGICVLGFCDPGYGDCNSTASDGCEVDTTSDPNNCGTCNVVCSLNNATESCTSGSCDIAACDAGYGDCNNSAGDGCEASTTTDPNNCGSCNAVCNLNNATESCSSGVCGIAACDAGYGDCNNSAGDGCEASTTTDPNNCGSCSNVCSLPNATEICSSGICGVGGCDAGYQDCDAMALNGCETDILTSLQHCGSCGAPCGGTCTNGVCMP